MADVVSLRGDPVLSPGEPDPKVVASLERCLEMAKSGELVAFALAFQYRDGSYGRWNAGIGSRAGLIGTMEALKHAMLSS